MNSKGRFLEDLVFELSFEGKLGIIYFVVKR